MSTAPTGCTAAKNSLDEVVVSYWNERSTTYSNYVTNSFMGETLRVWTSYLHPYLGSIPQHGVCDGAATLKVCDLGCGPGFFEILFSSLGCEVDAVDTSPAMLRKAEINLAAHVAPGNVSFHLAPADNLPFADECFDLVICRNVTWLMQDLERAYAEWKRVLVPRGKLLAFDAGWYSYLVDEKINAKRLSDQAAGTPEGWTEDMLATSDQEDRCERELAMRLQTTYLVRPEWDLVTLNKLGFSQVGCDRNAGDALLPEDERAYYASTPFFAIEATK